MFPIQNESKLNFSTFQPSAQVENRTLVNYTQRGDSSVSTSDKSCLSSIVDRFLNLISSFWSWLKELCCGKGSANTNNNSATPSGGAAQQPAGSTATSSTSAVSTAPEATAATTTTQQAVNPEVEAFRQEYETIDREFVWVWAKFNQATRHVDRRIHSRIPSAQKFHDLMQQKLGLDRQIKEFFQQGATGDLAEFSQKFARYKTIIQEVTTLLPTVQAQLLAKQKETFGDE